MELRAAAPGAGRPTVVALAVLAVGLQISYPLLHGELRMRMTVLIVCVFALTCLAHAAVSRGVGRAIAALVTTAGLGFGVEVVGVHTGVPFGDYVYAAGLGPRLAGVPVVVGLGWTMLVWPAAVAARRLVRGRVARVLVGAWALTSADLFLDPQLVAVGAWHWQHPSPHLPGVDTVPLTNLLGWVVAGLVVSAMVQTVAGDPVDDARDDVAVGLYLWLWAGWVVALSAFLQLPAAAAWGALGMGVVAVPLGIDTARRLRAGPQRASVLMPAATGSLRRNMPRARPPRTAGPATPHR